MLSFPKMLVVWWTNRNSVLISVLQSAQWINAERIYPQTRVSSFTGLISVARVNEQRTTDITRVLRTLGAEICQSACGVMNEQKFSSHKRSPECSMNKFRAYISTDTCFVLPRTYQCGYIYIGCLFGKTRLKSCGIGTYLSRWVCFQRLARESNK